MMIHMGEKKFKKKTFCGGFVDGFNTSEKSVPSIDVWGLLGLPTEWGYYLRNYL
jgi:hypothetical protein